MVSESIVSYLVADHARLHALLDRAMETPDLDPEAFAEFRRGLLRHIAIEERVLLPVVREVRGGIPLDRAHELRIDHAALTSLLVPTPDLALCREILSLLTEHDAKEEGRDGVYEECQRRLSDRDLARLAQRAESFPQVRVARHFDGPNVHRTAKGALASARRMRSPRKVEGR
ncbi:MAG: hemerythrin domain-containing protein [Deltaproteobacteria bacterium]|nr:hemerythrin domain-containing protein [Deltaproteobacteria bacterium]